MHSFGHYFKSPTKLKNCLVQMHFLLLCQIVIIIIIISISNSLHAIVSTRNVYPSVSLWVPFVRQKLCNLSGPLYSLTLRLPVAPCPPLFLLSKVEASSYAHLNELDGTHNSLRCHLTIPHRRQTYDFSTNHLLPWVLSALQAASFEIAPPK